MHSQNFCNHHNHPSLSLTHPSTPIDTITHHICRLVSPLSSAAATSHLNEAGPQNLRLRRHRPSQQILAPTLQVQQQPNAALLAPKRKASAVKKAAAHLYLEISQTICQRAGHASPAKRTLDVSI